MKVLFNCHVPFSLAHGGAQIQIEQTRRALELEGVVVEPLQWWEDTQRGDVLQHFGRLPAHILKLAQSKGMKVVVADLLTAMGSRPIWKIRLHRWMMLGVKKALPGQLISPLNWDTYPLADACTALTAWEAHLIRYLYDTPAGRVHVVPNGVEDVFFRAPAVQRGPWLICTATVTPRKRVLETAQAAVAARTPLWVLGRPYDERDAYGQEFEALAKAHPELVRYQGPMSDRQQLAEAYRSARGFVLLSTMESLSLSALEAAACETPLLLGDLPWASSVFGAKACYCSIRAGTDATATALRRFYDAAPTLPCPDRPMSWPEVARAYIEVYRKILR